jgi:hypothetical protein
MALIDLQRQILSLCFDETPSEAALAALGQRDVWLTYREMIRARLLRELRIALPRTRVLVGDNALLAAFAHHLAHEPPRTRFFRELVSEFVASALPLWAANPALHPACGDLARYELALWEVRDLATAPDEPVAEFSFEGVAVVSRALRLLALDHAVMPEDALEARPTFLCVQRPEDSERGKVWKLTPSTFQLLSRLAREDKPASEVIRDTAQGARFDAKYLDSVCGTLAQFLEAGIILGSR